ncbi:hypothetical protein LTR85_001274 [Meristemomyces frigidus]|nr:hypothetical protein LTR85_001274 [Meristemomyces frigidus]
MTEPRRFATLPRRFHKSEGVGGLTSTVVVSWQNQLFLAPSAIVEGGRGAYFWTSLVVFSGMYVVYVGLREKGERWATSAGQFLWVFEMAPRRYARQLSFFSGWMLTISWQAFLSAAVMIVGNAAASLVVLHTDTNRFWLPTVLSIATTICVFGMNYWGFRLLARLQHFVLFFHVIVWLFWTLTLLGLRTPKILFATPSSAFLDFRNNSGYSDAGVFFTTAWVALSSASGYDCVFHMSKPSCEP